MVAAVIVPVISNFVDAAAIQNNWYSDPNGLVKNFLSTFAYPWTVPSYRLFVYLAVAIAAGYWMRGLQFRLSAHSSQLAIERRLAMAAGLRRQANRLTSALQDKEREASRFGGPQPIRLSFDDYNQFKALLLSLSQEGLRVPKLSEFPLDWDEVFKWFKYCTEIYPMLESNHLTEARRRSKAISRDWQDDPDINGMK